MSEARGVTTPLIQSALTEIEKLVAAIGQQENVAAGVADPRDPAAPSQGIFKQFRSKVEEPLLSAKQKISGEQVAADGTKTQVPKEAFLEPLPLYGIPKMDSDGNAVGYTGAKADDVGASPIRYADPVARRRVTRSGQGLREQIQAGITSPIQALRSARTVTKNAIVNQDEFFARAKNIDPNDLAGYQMGNLAMLDAKKDASTITDALQVLQGSQKLEQLQRTVRENLALANDTSGSKTSYDRLMGFSRAKTAYQGLSSYVYDSGISEHLSAMGFGESEKNKRTIFSTYQTEFRPQFDDLQAKFDSQGIGSKSIQKAVGVLDSRENALVGLNTKNIQGARLTPSSLLATSNQTKARIGKLMARENPESDIAKEIFARMGNTESEYSRIAAEQTEKRTVEQAAKEQEKQQKEAAREQARRQKEAEREQVKQRREAKKAETVAQRPINAATRILDSRENALTGIRSRHENQESINPAILNATAKQTEERIGRIMQGVDPESDIAKEIFGRANQVQAGYVEIAGQQRARGDERQGDKRYEAANKALDSRAESLAKYQRIHDNGGRINPAAMGAQADTTQSRIAALARAVSNPIERQGVLERAAEISQGFQSIGTQQQAKQDFGAAEGKGQRLLVGSRDALARYDAAKELHKDFKNDNFLGIQSPIKAAMTSELLAEKQERGNALLREMVELQKDIKILTEQAKKAGDEGDTEGAKAFRQQADEGEKLYDEAEKKHKESRTFSVGGVQVGGPIGGFLGGAAASAAAVAAPFLAVGGAAMLAYSAGAPARDEEIKAYNLEAGLGMNRRTLDLLRPNSIIDPELTRNGLGVDDMLGSIGVAKLAGFKSEDQVGVAKTAGLLARERGLEVGQVSSVVGTTFLANRDMSAGNLQDTLALLNKAMSDGVKNGIASSELAQATEDILNSAKASAGGGLSDSDIQTRLGIVQSAATSKTSAMKGANGAAVREGVLESLADPVSPVMGAVYERIRGEMAQTGKSFGMIAAPNATESQQRELNQTYQSSNILALRKAGVFDQTTMANRSADAIHVASNGNPVLMDAALRDAIPDFAKRTRYLSEQFEQGKPNKIEVFKPPTTKGEAPKGIGEGTATDSTGLAGASFLLNEQGKEIFLAASRAMFQATIPFVDVAQKAVLGLTQVANAATRAAVNLNGANSVSDPTKGIQAGIVHPDLGNEKGGITVGAGKDKGVTGIGLIDDAAGAINDFGERVKPLLKTFLPIFSPNGEENIPTSSLRRNSGYMAKEVSGIGKNQTTATVESSADKPQRVEVQIGVETKGEIKGAKTKTLTTTRVNTPPAIG